MASSTYTYLVQTIKHLPITKQNEAIHYNLVRRFVKLSNYVHCDFLSICRLCGINYNDKIPNVELKPGKKLNRFLRRQQRNSDESLYATKYQMRSLKKLKKYSKRHTLHKICQFCKCNQSRVIHKLGIKKQKYKHQKVKNRSYTGRVTKKNFSGLNKSAVLAVKKTAREIMTLGEIVTPTKPKLDSEVIVLDTPAANSSNICENKSDNDSSDSDSSDSDSSDTDDSVVFIDETPVPQQKVYKLVNSKPAKPHNCSVIDLSTPNFKPTPSASSKKKPTTKWKRKKVAKKQRLADDSLTIKKAKKRNTLSAFLKDNNEVTKTISNLEQFLKSVS